MVDKATDSPTASGSAGISCPCCRNRLTLEQYELAYAWWRKRRRGMALASLFLLVVGAVFWIVGGSHQGFLPWLFASIAVNLTSVVIVPTELWKRRQVRVESDETRFH